MHTLLIVEDDPSVRTTMVTCLELEGYVVTRATNGLEALHCVERQLPGLVLLDMRMPVLDGWEATRRIKADERTKRIPIIALTAHAMQGDEQKAKEAGCDDYDVKPVDLQRLLAKIEALLGGAPAP